MGNLIESSRSRANFVRAALLQDGIKDTDETVKVCEDALGLGASLQVAREELATLRAALQRAEGALANERCAWASLVDFVNIWAREDGVEQAEMNPALVKKTLDMLWGRASQVFNALAAERAERVQLEEALRRIRDEDTQVVLGDAGKNRLTIGKFGSIARRALTGGEAAADPFGLREPYKPTEPEPHDNRYPPDGQGVV